MTKKKQNIPERPGISKGSHKAISKAEFTKVVTQIVERTQYRARKDIRDWMVAFQSAESIEYPRRLLLYNVYDMVCIDNHLKGIIEHALKEKLRAQPFKITAASGGDELTEKTALLQAEWFNTLTDWWIDTIFWGHSLIQINDLTLKTKRALSLLPRRNIRPETGELLRTPSDATGIPYRDTPLMDWLIEIGDDGDLGEWRNLGLFSVLAPNALWKKNAMVAWSEFIEIFGVPIRTGKITSDRKQDIDRMEHYLKNMGKSSYAIFKEGDEITIERDGIRNPQDVFDPNIDRCNKEMSKAIIGVTMATDDGSSRSQAEVHENILEDVIEALKVKFSAFINYTCIPKFIQHGLPLEGCLFSYQEVKDLDALFDRTFDLLTFFDIDPQWIEDNFGIPVTKKVAAPIDDAEDPEGAIPPAKSTNPAQKKKPPPPTLKVGATLAVAQMHQRLTSLYFHHSHKHGATLAASDEPGKREGDQVDPPDADADYDAIWQRLAKGIQDGSIKPGDVDPELIETIAQQLWHGVVKGFGSTLGDPDNTPDDDEMLRNLQENVYIFSAFKTWEQLREAADLLIDSNGKARTENEFIKEIDKLNIKYNKTYARTEYNQAITSATNASTWVDAQNEKTTLPYLRFDAIGGNSCVDCAAADGVTLPVDDPYWDSNYPPIHWGCGDTITQVNDTHEPTKQDDLPTPQLDNRFNTNMAKDGVVFPPNHPYYEASKAQSKRITKAAKDLIPDNDAA